MKDKYREGRPFCYVINGSGGCGKDEFIKQCKMACNIPIHNISTVDKIKECAEILGWDGKKTPRDRKFLSDLKDLSTEYSEHPKKYVLNYVFKTAKEHEIVFIHSREPEEVLWFRNMLPNCKTILVERNNVDKIVSNHADANVSNCDYDIYISNNGTINDLYLKAEDFIGNVYE